MTQTSELLAIRRLQRRNPVEAAGKLRTWLTRDPLEQEREIRDLSALAVEVIAKQAAAMSTKEAWALLKLARRTLPSHTARVWVRM